MIDIYHMIDIYQKCAILNVRKQIEI